LESGRKYVDGLSDRVAHTEAVNYAQEAEKQERAHIRREVRSTVMVGFALFGLVFSVATYFLENGQ